MAQRCKPRLLEAPICRGVGKLFLIVCLAVTLASQAAGMQRLGKKGKPPESTVSAENRNDAGRESRRQPPASDRIAAAPKDTAPNTRPVASPKAANTRQRAGSRPQPQPATGGRTAERSDANESLPPASPPQTDYSAAQIEAIEHNSQRYHTVSKQISQTPAGRPSSGDGKGKFNISNRRIEVDIAPERIVEIQTALIARGLLTGEPTGLYDEATIEAMRRFQLSLQIDVTGYPTAHALKHLGLN